MCVSPGTPAAERLAAFGLTEGAPNRHPGQGTACRRFFFRNAMLELLWMDEPAAVRSEGTARRGWGSVGLSGARWHRPSAFFPPGQASGLAVGTGAGTRVPAHWDD
ncbi:MAG: hypothetical protein ACM3ST_13340 [Bdellovibrio bacteriovorus]